MKILGEGTKVVYKTKRQVVAVQCNRCKSVIPVSDDEEKNLYFSVVTGDNADDDNDSRYDICPACLIPHLQEHFTDFMKWEPHASIYALRAEPGHYEYEECEDARLAACELL